MRRLLVVMALPALAACPIELLKPDGGGTGGGGAQSMAPPPIPTEVFGVVSGATRLLADVGNARLELDPTQRDALTALAECADLVSYCYAPPQLSISDCFGRARKCTTTTPWTEGACCPEACKTAFDAEVQGGLDPVQALEKVLFRQPDCFPGVRALLEAP